MNKKIIGFLGGVSLLFSLVTLASAHVTVKPQEAGVGAFQTFTMGVPNEKDNLTVSLRLVIPDGLHHVSPNVKPGWTIEVMKTGEGEDAEVTELVWTGGSIPVGQRDEFLFNAQVPAEATTVNWKAYQTYQDGTVVSWDQDPTEMKNMSDAEKEEMEKTGKGPFSQTTIVNDLKSQTQTAPTTSSEANRSYMFSIIALAISVLALGIQLRKNK